MSKSDPSDLSRINLTDDADTIAKKIQKAKTDPEPLPADSPLRSLPNVIITPHLAGLTWGTRGRGTDRFCANIVRFLRDEPLEGLVDRVAGY